MYGDMKSCYTVVSHLELVRLCGVLLPLVLQSDDNEEEIIQWMYFVASCCLFSQNFIIFVSTLFRKFGLLSDFDLKLEMETKKKKRSPSCNNCFLLWPKSSFANKH